MIAHVIGWIVHAALLRDWRICMIISVGFEICERLLKPWFPNFNECWWDSIIIDIIICNGLGIYIGMKLVKYFTLMPWETRLIGECESGTDWIMRAFKQFTPRSYQKFDWRPFETVRRYYIVIIVIIGINLFELNIFGMKMVLKLAPTNGFVIAHCALHAIQGFPAMFEAYRYAIGASETIGNFGITFIILVLSECWLIYRFSEGYFTEPMPLSVRILVPIAALIALVVFPLMWFGLLKRGKSKEK
jgi:phosphatidylserine synthase 2